MIIKELDTFVFIGKGLKNTYNQFDIAQRVFNTPEILFNNTGLFPLLFRFFISSPR